MIVGKCNERTGVGSENFGDYIDNAILHLVTRMEMAIFACIILISQLRNVIFQAWIVPACMTVDDLPYKCATKLPVLKMRTEFETMVLPFRISKILKCHRFNIQTTSVIAKFIAKTHTHWEIA